MSRTRSPMRSRRPMALVNGWRRRRGVFRRAPGADAVADSRRQHVVVHVKGFRDGCAGRLVVTYVAGDHGEAVHQRRRGDLLVQRVLCMWDPQLAPYVRDLLIEWQDRVSVITGDRAEPTRKASRLREVATMAHCFNALPQLADRDRREEQRDALRRSISKEPTNTGVGASALSRVADDVCVDEVHRLSSRPPVDLAALEVGVFAGVGHRREYLSQ